MRQIAAVFYKEWLSCFAKPAIWLQIALLAALGMALTFFWGNFFDAGRADLAVYFRALPLALMFVVPIIGAGLWAAEFEKGTIDLIYYGRYSALMLCIGKFLALSAMLLLALAFMLPLWLAISWLGQPDHLALFAGLVGAVLMVSALASIMLFASSIADNSASAILLGLLFIAVLSISSLSWLIPSLPPFLADAIASFSISQQFAGFARGTIPLSGVIYFLSLSVFGIFASQQMVCARISGTVTRSVLPVIAGFLALVSGNIILHETTRTLRLDMTASKAFTLSPEAKQIIKQLQHPRKLTFYYSAPLAAKYPDIRAFAAQITETLNALQSNSGGLVSFSQRIITIDSRAEDAAIIAGISAVITNDGQPLYFGLADMNGALINRFDPDRAAMLEYDLLSALLSQSSQKPKLSLLDTTDIAGTEAFVTGQGPSTLYKNLLANYNFDETFTASNSDLYLLIHPQGKAANKWFNQRLTDDKPLRALVLVDPYRENATLPGRNGLPMLEAKMSSRLPIAINELGVHLAENSVVIDPELAASSQTQIDGKSRTINYPAWLQLTPRNISGSGVLQNAISRKMVFASSGAFTTTPVAGWQFKPLLLSSDQAMLVPQELLANGASTAQLLAAGSDARQQILAGILINKNHDKQILLIADTDFIADGFYGVSDPVFGWQELADNGRFILTAMQMLSLAPELMQLPAKAKADRPMSRIVIMRTTATQLQTKATANLEQLQSQLTDELLTSNDPAATAKKLQQTRQQIRHIRKSFNAKILWIERWLLFSNVFLFPAMFAVFGLFITSRATIKPIS